MNPLAPTGFNGATGNSPPFSSGLLLPVLLSSRDEGKNFRFPKETLRSPLL